MVAGLLRRNGVSDPSTVVFIGDTLYDIDAAAALEIDSIGVTYGFSSQQEIISFDPDYIAETVSDLQKILIIE